LIGRETKHDHFSQAISVFKKKLKIKKPKVLFGCTLRNSRVEK